MLIHPRRCDSLQTAFAPMQVSRPEHGRVSLVPALFAGFQTMIPSTSFPICNHLKSLNAYNTSQSNNLITSNYIYNSSEYRWSFLNTDSDFPLVVIFLDTYHEFLDYRYLMNTYRLLSFGILSRILKEQITIFLHKSWYFYRMFWSDFTYGSANFKLENTLKKIRNSNSLV